MSVNIYKIMELLHERRTIQLTDSEEDLYCNHFQRSGMRPTQFKRLMQNAVKRSHHSGSRIAEEGKPTPNTLLLLMNGTVRIQKNNEDIFIVEATKPICFLVSVLVYCEYFSLNEYVRTCVKLRVVVVHSLF
jgi:hypothetical protein